MLGRIKKPAACVYLWVMGLNDGIGHYRTDLASSLGAWVDEIDDVSNKFRTDRVAVEWSVLHLRRCEFGETRIDRKNMENL